MKLPFSWYPYTWGLTGKSREIAQAEYSLTGYDLECKLLIIKKDEMSEDDFKKKLWDIDLKHGKITESQYHRNLTELIHDPKQKSLAILELDYREGTISDLTYEKTIATIKGEPWVNVVNMNFVNKTALEGSFELDWNDAFIEKLKSDGYKGLTSDIIVNTWFMEVCRNVAMEEFDGTGDFTADSEANLDAVKRWSADTVQLPTGRKGYK